MNETWWPVPGAAEETREPLIADGSGDDVHSFLFDLAADPNERVNLYDAR